MTVMSNGDFQVVDKNNNALADVSDIISINQSWNQ